MNNDPQPFGNNYEEKPMKILILGLASYTELNVYPSDTILHVKQRIQDEERYHPRPELQRLVYSGKTLDDDLTLRDYNIKPGTKIYLALKLGSGPRSRRKSRSFKKRRKTRRKYL